MEQLPVLIRNFGVEDNKTCEWRQWKLFGFLVAFSLDVGFIQKVTLLGLVIGIFFLRWLKIQLQVDDFSFPERDKRESDRPEADSWPRRAEEHPVTVAYGGDANRPPLYPRSILELASPHAESAIRTYRRNVEDARTLFQGASRGATSTSPFDLIIDIVDTGQATGSVGACDERMRSTVFDYHSQLQEKFWPVEYILWLLPTIGFLGTIYGISVSLVKAKGIFKSGSPPEEFALSIGGVVDGLGQAFDTTSMALISAAVLFLLMRQTEALTRGTAERAKRTMANLLIARMTDRP